MGPPPFMKPYEGVEYHMEQRIYEGIQAVRDAVDNTPPDKVIWDDD